jgi:hypothetical protein
MIFFNHVFFKVACATAGEAQRWMEAFEQAKNQVCMYEKINNSKFSLLLFYCFVTTQDWLWCIISSFSTHKYGSGFVSISKKNLVSKPLFIMP